ncbi:MAG: Ribosomal protein [Candidatus Parcubacteria bacterium]|jgi:ribosomal protein S20
MPNKHAAIKDLRKNVRHAARNARLKMHTKQLLRQATDLIKEGGLAEAKAAAIKFQKIVDKAAKNRVVSRSFADRKKSSIMKAISGKK